MTTKIVPEKLQILTGFFKIVYEFNRAVTEVPGGRSLLTPDYDQPPCKGSQVLSAQYNKKDICLYKQSD